MGEDALLQFAIAELMRLLVDVEAIAWPKAFDICGKTLGWA